jgi:hypothetical protein
MKTDLVQFLSASLEAGHNLRSLIALCNTFPRQLNAPLECLPIPEVEFNSLDEFPDPRHADYGSYEAGMMAAKARNGEDFVPAKKI